jgi:hemerythrin-like domain-containing protein
MPLPDPVANWHADHVNFARLLDVLEEQVEVFGAGDTPGYDLMLDIVYYMTHYSDVVHHPKEDLVFDRVAQRNPALAVTVRALADEHAALKEAGERLARELDDVLNGSLEPRERVQRLAREYVGLMRGHMNVEEAQVFPVARQLLTQADWIALTPVMPDVPDPLFGPTIETRYAALRDQIERSAGTRTPR